MVKQYAYQLEVLSIPDTVFDEKGNIIPPVETWNLVANCRDESGHGKKVTMADGLSYDYSFLVQLPKGVEAVEVGKRVRVLSVDHVRCEGVVIYSRKDQLHTRLWV